MKNDSIELVPVVCQGIPSQKCGRVFEHLPQVQFDRMRLAENAVCDSCYAVLISEFPPAYSAWRKTKGKA